MRVVNASSVKNHGEMHKFIVVKDTASLIHEYIRILHAEGDGITAHKFVIEHSDNKEFIQKVRLARILHKCLTHTKPPMWIMIGTLVLMTLLWWGSVLAIYLLFFR